MQQDRGCGWRLKALLRGVGLATLMLAAGAAVAIEEPTYKVLAMEGDFEVRSYTPYLVVETRIEDAFDAAGNEGFDRLFQYITGNNRGRAKISMTAPVSQSAAGEKIAMTAPVAQASDAGGYRVSFMLPSSYTLETAPTPLDQRVTIRVVPGELAAVVRFSGFWSEEKGRDQEERLRKFIAERRLEAVGSPRLARYDPPFTPQSLRRNEILITVAAYPPPTAPVPMP